MRNDGSMALSATRMESIRSEDGYRRISSRERRNLTQSHSDIRHNFKARPNGAILRRDHRIWPSGNTIAFAASSGNTKGEKPKRTIRIPSKHRRKSSNRSTKPNQSARTILANKITSFGRKCIHSVLELQEERSQNKEKKESRTQNRDYGREETIDRKRNAE